MSHRSPKLIMTLVSVIVVIAVVLGVRSYQGSGGSPSEAVTEERIKGNSQAPLKIVEYIDFQCPACKTGSNLLSQFMRENPDAVHLEMKYFPLSGHRHGFSSAKYAQCAARQGKFWVMHDILLERQGQWKNLVDAQPAFAIMVKDLDLNASQLESCLESDEVAELINENKNEGRLIGIRSTPSYVINGELVVGVKSLQERLAQFKNNN